MQETRRARLQSVIQERLSAIIRSELKDPRVPPITLTSVEVTPDGSQATVFVAILGGARGGHGRPELSDEEAKRRMRECLDGLGSAANFLRRLLSREIEIRHVPNLIFKEDKGIENVSRVHELLKKISVNSDDNGDNDGGEE